MPYIKPKDRLKYERTIECVPGIISGPGELNFLITQMCREYILSQGESYQTYNDIIGALNCAGMELYRRKIAPYEDKKISENSDVW